MYCRHNRFVSHTESKNAKFLVWILNSKAIDWLFRRINTNNNVNIYELESLSIPKIDSTNKNLANEIIALVDKILESKAKDSSIDTSELESKIDTLVYKLYGLDSNEIKLINS